MTQSSGGLRANAERRRVAVVTTMHREGHAQYGADMVASYLRHMPADVPLHLYAEGFASEVDAPGRLVVHDLLASAPGLVAFKARHRDNALLNGRRVGRRFKPHWTWNRSGQYRPRLFQKTFGYRFDAVRFAHKVFAIFHAARHVDADVLVWIDADTRFFADVPREVVESWVPPDCLVGHLARKRLHTECGVVAYNLRHPAIRSFLDDFEACYTEDLLLREQEFHDSWLFDRMLERQRRRGHRAHDIGGGIGAHAEHVLVNSALGAYMDHLKGDRKADGQSRREDLLVDRPEAYWRLGPQRSGA